MIVKKSTLEVVQESELRSQHSNVSFPNVLTDECLEGYDYTVVTPPPRPVLGEYQSAILGAPEIVDGEITVGWIVSTNVPARDVLLREYERAIDDMLHAAARAHRYDSVYTMISYKGDPNPQFDLEARSMFAWRSAVWTAANDILSQFSAGEELALDDIPSVEEVLALLPEFALLEA